MPNPIDRAGIFRGVITAYGLNEANSGAVSLRIKAKIWEWWNADLQQWEDWTDYEFEAEGEIWLIKTDKTVNQNQVAALASCCGWDGLVDSLVNETWQPERCQFAIESDEYRGKVRFRVSFLNNYDRTPGGLNRLDPAKTKTIALKYGAKFRAIASEARNVGGPPPANRPAAPSAPRQLAAARPEPPIDDVPAEEARDRPRPPMGDDKDIPF